MVNQFFKDLKREFAGYNSAKLMKDVMAGLTVCAVALPLALAFGVEGSEINAIVQAVAGILTAAGSAIAYINAEAKVDAAAAAKGGEGK